MTEEMDGDRPVPGQAQSPTPAAGPSNDLVVLGEVWDALNRSRRGILSVVVLAILVALLIAFTLPQIYRATATLVIKSNISRPIESVPNVYNPGAGQPGWYATQFKIIKSRSVVGQVVDRLDLVDNPVFANVVKPPSGFDWGELVPSDWKQWLPFLPTQEPVAKSEQQIKEDKRERLIDHIRSRMLHVETTIGSKLVAVSVDSKDPQIAAKIANAIVDVYIDLGVSARLEMAEHFSSWLGDRLGTIKQNLADAEQALQQFKEKQNLVDLGEVGGVLQSQLSSYMDQLHQAKLAMTKLGSAYHKIQQAGSNAERLDSVSTLLADPVVRAAKTNMLRAEQEVETLSARYGPKHPKMIRAQAELQSATQAYHHQLVTAAAGVRARYQVAAQTVNELSGVVNNIRGQMQQLGSKSSKLGVLQRNVKANQQLYNTFLQRVMETSAMGDYQAVLARSVDKATVPNAPYKPNKKFIVVVAAVLGLLLGLALALLRYFLVDVIRSTEDLEKCTGLSVFGVLPLLKRSWSSKLELTQPSLKGFAEGIRSIRTSMKLADMTERKQVLMITSADPNEGKTTVALNLAAAFGQGERVLLIDGDLRKPNLSRRLKLHNQKKGLVDLLAGEADKNECIVRYEEGGIDVLPTPTQPPNGSELAGSPRFEAMIRELSADYDRIVLDTSPCQAVGDPLLLSRFCEAVVLVVKVEQTRRRSIRRTLSQLQSANANVLGVVANQVDKRREKSYYYGYYSYYGYGA